MLFVACAFAACSSDDAAVLLPVTPSFNLISMGSYDLSVLDSEDYIITPIEFSSSAAWQLTSDKIWVLFSTTEDGEYYNDIIGAAGTHTVYMKITNDARTFEPSGANVVFNLGLAQHPLGTIYRHAKLHETAILDENGNEISSVEIGGDATLVIGLSANYVCGIKSYPEWLTDPEPYNGKYILKVSEEYVPYAKSGEIVIASEDGTSEQAFPINYSGMRSDAISISSDYTPWGWSVALDGKTFLCESTSPEGDIEEIVVENALPFKIKCLNYDCKFLFIEEGANGAISIPAEPWLVAEQNESDLSSVNIVAKTLSEPTAKRKGYMLALPAGIYDDIYASLSAATDIVTFVDENYKYVIAEVTQRDIFAIEGFSVTGSDGTSFITEEEPAGDLYDWVSSELSITDVYTMNGVNGVKYTVNTLYTEADWGGGYSIYDKSNNSYTNARVWGLSRKLVDGYYVLTFTVPAATRFTEPVIIRLHTSNVNKKALIIKPVN